jgi:putative transposase
VELNIFKSFRYRIYPTAPVQHTLISWMFGLEVISNLAHEQRLAALSRSEGQRPAVSVFSQQRELTDLRKEHIWIRKIPRHLSAQVLVNLDQAWQKCFTKASGKPKWKSRRNPIRSLKEFDPRCFSLEGIYLKFPKLPPIRTIVHRPLEGKPKTCTIRRDGDQWFVVITCEINTEAPAPRTEPRIGLDRGITNFIADSSGNLVQNPKFLDSEARRMARAQRTLSRRVKGSKNFEKAKNRVNRLHRSIRRKRDHFLHETSAGIAKDNGTVVVENLQVKNMVRNRCLSRQISQVAWSRFAEFLEYKLAWSGGTLVRVAPHHTSQECSACEHIDRASRNGEYFSCTKCGFNEHADINAAKVILRRSSRSVQPAEGSSDRTPLGNRKVKLRVPRRSKQNSGHESVLG